ncbi:hypothetical protein [Micromonospora sp. WMMD987]|jgi:hypothetical protein|uniref:hypothetical protein n=1 Tax=Micromonospora TaxID=1873 RepID=UPI00249BA421|nr:hypothetical protein [Micromonospora sp. WMMD987]WFE92856.1 hypothetical protein O7612_15615 [Micromonospora sp. WMMD987]
MSINELWTHVPEIILTAKLVSALATAGWAVARLGQQVRRRKPADRTTSTSDRP